MTHEILVVDDEEDIRHQLSGVLEDAGYATRTASTVEEAKDALGAGRPDLILLDLWLSPGRDDGMTILNLMQKIAWDVPVIVISGHATIETAVSATKAGAYDVIEKPFQAARLLLILKRALEISRLRRENLLLRDQAEFSHELIGETSAINEVRRVIHTVAPTNSRVFIQGPSGSGKELVARLIHQHSPRQNNPFVVINCTSYGPTEIEEVLFGVSDPQTPNVPLRVGALEQTVEGTLLLDEVGHLTTAMQAKLARSLQDQTFSRLGTDRRIRFQGRVLATSSEGSPLPCKDLLYRLAVVEIILPGLRERLRDIPALCDYFMARAAASLVTSVRGISDDAMTTLQSMSWPGNLRQLQNTIEGLVIRTSEGETITPKHLASLVDNADSQDVDAAPSWSLPPHLVSQSLRNAREAFEVQYFTQQLERFAGSTPQMVDHVGMERSAIYRKIKSLGIDLNAPAGTKPSAPTKPKDTQK